MCLRPWLIKGAASAWGLSSVRLLDPQPRDLENPDVALEALRLDGAEGGLVEIHRPPASATDSRRASLADQVMAWVSR
jgi:hypothetical protein